MLYNGYIAAAFAICIARQNSSRVLLRAIFKHFAEEKFNLKIKHNY